MSSGFEDLNRLSIDLELAGAVAHRRASVAVAKTAASIDSTAKAFAPVDTGNLRNSISHDVKGTEAEIGPTASYGAHVEYGTSRMAPHAYMGPALDRHGHELQTALEQIAADTLEG